MTRFIAPLRFRPLWMLPILLVHGCSLFAASGADGQYDDQPPADLQAALQQRVIELENSIRDGEFGLVDEVLVQYAGEQVFHLKHDHRYSSIAGASAVLDGPYKYDHGAYSYADSRWHPYYQGSDLHSMQSVTKSVVSLLVGIAETRRDLPYVSEAKLVDHISRRYSVNQSDEYIGQVTVEHILQMRMNLEWNEAPPFDETNNVVALEWIADDWVQYVLGQQMSGEPGIIYQYNGGATQLLGGVLEHATGMNVEQYAKLHLFEPMGISEFYWKTTPDGMNDLQGGLYLRAVDLAKFCKLMSNGGDWNGAQILSSDFVRRALIPWSDLRAGNELPSGRQHPVGYGYKWWIDAQSANEKVYSMRGYGGQRMICFPQKELTIVILGWNVADIDRPDLVMDYNLVSDSIQTRVVDDIYPLIKKIHNR